MFIKRGYTASKSKSIKFDIKTCLFRERKNVSINYVCVMHELLNVFLATKLLIKNVHFKLPEAEPETLLKLCIRKLCIRSQVFANLVSLLFNMKAGADSGPMPSCQWHIK